jgi:ATP-dependent DNA helicase DinG
MAEAVAAIIEDGGLLLAEAGTGTGKTVAYLTPAILSGHRVLVSTGTKNLQEQIFFKDLPALQQALGRPFTATLMKGRSNYLCLHRWDQQRLSPERDMLTPLIDEWAAHTDTGDRAELRDLPEELPFWRSVSAEAESCLGATCPRYADCFITRMRQRAAESDVVIVNHHLLCADAAVRHGDYGEVIPECPTLIVDEAHQLEDVATQYFGRAFSNLRVDDLLRDVDVGRSSAARQQEEILRAAARVADRNRSFFTGLARMDGRLTRSDQSRGARYDAETLADHFEGGMLLAGALEALEATLALAQHTDAASDAEPPVTSAGDVASPATGASGFGRKETLATLQRRAGELRDDLRFLMRASDPDFVYFIEARGKGIFLKASPIDVSRIVPDALFERMRSTVLTSATLAVDDSFAYVKSRLGVKEPIELRVPSEFDYRTQTLLYLPRRMPPPQAATFAEAAAREVLEILRRSQGRAFVLFTSYAVLRTVQGFVEMSLPFPVLVQGTAPRTELIDRFRATPNAVLLATSSFWQGVDVVGEALSCVIVDKLPFASPGDPVTAARIDGLRAAGRDPFADYQVPLAILTLQQGLGRLIRHRTDRGVLAVLDPRLRSMGYGRRFLASLPPAPVTHELDAVAEFFRVN